MKKFGQTLLLVLAGIGNTLVAQNNCNNPVSLNSVLISNTICGAATGTVIVSPAGGVGGYVFQWTPAVSNSNVALGLQAGTYNIHIERANDPDCFLDTLVVVNNSNGPQVQSNITPAQCFAANGSVILTPGNLLYHWSTGTGTNSLQGLASGNYYVTATNPGNGCYSVLKITIPRTFDFDVNAEVIQHTKCGKSIGKAKITVPNGSGQYSYSCGPLPVLNNLAAGTYTCVVTDNVTGCTNSVSFTINNLPVSGDVQLTPHQLRCNGDANGSVDIQVTPGQNFRTPYTYTLTDGNGVSQNPGHLPAGSYSLQIFDADFCALPVENFTITAPPAITSQTQINPETCTEGGSLLLTINGGTGAHYVVDWQDLPGNVNPQNRGHLRAGLYSAIIYDSLFCTENLDSLLVKALCNKKDTTHLIVKTNSTEVYCWNPPVGLLPGDVSYTLPGGGTSGSSSHGAWSLDPGGCLAYTAGTIPGNNLDLICVSRSAPLLGLHDTLCLLVSIIGKQATKQSVFFTVQAGTTAAACGTIPPSFQHYTIFQLDRPGLDGTSDVYGSYLIHADNACIDFMADTTTGFSVDEIRVAVCDTVLNECHIISYFPSVIEPANCQSVFNLPDTLALMAPDCNSLASGCINIAYDDIVNYTIIDNGSLYNSGYTGCDSVLQVSYTISALPAGGAPYQLDGWTVNGQTFSGAFLNLAGLAALMNQFDPSPGWKVQGAAYIRGGNPAFPYGPLHIKSAGGAQGDYLAQVLTVSGGTELHLGVGGHQLIFKNVLNACADTLHASVACVDCPPVHSYSLDPFGNVKWQTAGGCNSDTLFCTNIPWTSRNEYSISDNNVPVSQFEPCGNYTGIRLDTGFHLLHFLKNTGDCQYNVRFYLNCTSILSYDTVHLNIPVGQSYSLCLDTSLIPGTVSYLYNYCEDDAGSPVLSYSYNQQQWCVDMTGINTGLDTLCLQMCDANNVCTNTIVYVNVSGQVSDSLQAIDDQVYTLKNTDVDISFLSNDIIRGIPGNRTALSGVDFLHSPAHGAITYNPVSGLLTYSPNLDACGIDSFSYRITDTLGRQSVATVTIHLVCDKVFVFNGISPNGDGLNDTWKILGIEQFPASEVRVFNRWGNQVYEKQGYNNADGWDGTWNGKALPDGTYFYVILLGGGNGRQQGYLQILR